MRKIIKRLLGLTLGMTCCAGAAFAASPADDGLTDRSSMLRLSGVADQSYLQSLPEPSPEALREDFQGSTGSDLDVMEVVYRISYLGAVVLTADRVVRSVDSVMDRMQFECDDGTCLRFVMEPKRRGFDVMLRMSRPLDF